MGCGLVALMARDVLTSSVLQFLFHLRPEEMNTAFSP